MIFLWKTPEAETEIFRTQHTTIILTTAVAEGRPPWRSIIWNESARNRPNWRVIFKCGTRTVPHACYYVRPRPEPERAHAPGRAHDQPRKAWKARRHPVPPPQLPNQFLFPSSQPATKPSRSRLKGGFLPESVAIVLLHQRHHRTIILPTSSIPTPHTTIHQIVITCYLQVHTTIIN